MARNSKGALFAFLFAMAALVLYFWHTGSRSDGADASRKHTSAIAVTEAQNSRFISTAGADAAAAGSARPATYANQVSGGDWAYALVSRSPNALEALSRLRADSRTTPATLKYYEAFLAEACSTYLPKSQSNPDPKTAQEIAQQRLTALSYANFCSGMEPLTASQIATLWSAAAAAGDKRAIALLAWRSDHEKSQTDEARANGRMNPPPALSVDTTQKLLDAVATHDPSAIVNLGKLLAQTSQTHYLALDNGQALSELRPEVWSLLACDFGMDCSQNNSVMLAACAHDNACNYDSLESLYKGKYWTPEESERLERSREILREVVATGSMNRLQFRPFDPGDSVTRMTIRPSPLKWVR